MAVRSLKAKLRQAFLAEYGINDSSPASTKEYDNEETLEKANFAAAMLVMRMVREDGEPHFIPGYDFLAVGSIGCAYNETSLRSNNITSVITLTELANKTFDHIEYLYLPIPDSVSTDLSSALEQCCDFISRQKHTGNILIHCYKGVSRCVAIVIGYLIQIHGLTYDLAMAKVRLARPQAGPNAGFIRQLQRLAQKDIVYRFT